MKRELEGEEREKDKKDIEKHTSSYQLLGSSVNSKRRQGQAHGHVMVSLLNPRASMDPPLRWDFWSFSHSGVGLGQCSTAPVYPDWQTLWDWDAGSMPGEWSISLPCQSKVWPVPSITHAYIPKCLETSIFSSLWQGWIFYSYWITLNNELSRTSHVN